MAGGNIYPAGQCTWYAADRDGWVLSKGNLGNAMAWSLAWRLKGGSVTGAPANGAIACFQPGAGGAGPIGHVAVVEGVNPDGTFNVSEMNVLGLGVVDRRQNLKPGLGVSFLLPPGGSSGGVVSQLQTTPVDAPGPIGALAVPGLSAAASGVLSGLVGFVLNGGLVVLGAVGALAGVWFVTKGESPGGAVGKVVEALPAGKVGNAARAVKSPLKTATAARKRDEAEARRNKREQAENQKRFDREQERASARALKAAKKPRRVAGYSNAQRRAVRSRYGAR